MQESNGREGMMRRGRRGFIEALVNRSCAASDFKKENWVDLGVGDEQMVQCVQPRQ